MKTKSLTKAELEKLLGQAQAANEQLIQLVESYKRIVEENKRLLEKSQAQVKSLQKIAGNAISSLEVNATLAGLQSKRAKQIAAAREGRLKKGLVSRK